MDAMKFLSEAKRMCNNAGPCETCDANEFCGFTPEFPSDFGEVDQMQKMVKLVEKWAEEHPRKTRQSEVLKQWPNAKMNPFSGTVDIPPCCLDKSLLDECRENTSSCNDCRRKYWLKAVE